MKWIKAVVVLIVIAIAAGAMTLWYDTVIVGEYFTSAGVFLSIVAAAVPIAVLVIAFYIIRFVVRIKPSDFDL